MNRENRGILKHVILLDKPETLTSMQCVERVKKTIGARKAGHSGTLDPKVTGLMIIALDEALKAMPVFLGMDKEYEGIIHLHSSVSLTEFRKAASGFVGQITQRPPVRSAVARIPRKRTVHSFRIMGKSGRDVLFRVRCEAGTYIRKLCSDIGESLGSGAHMASLRRTGIGGFSVKEAVTMERIEKEKVKCLIPLENALERAGLKRVEIKESSVRKVGNGLPVRWEDVEKADRGIKPGEVVGIYSGSRIIALGMAQKDYPEGRNMFKTDRVFRK